MVILRVIILLSKFMTSINVENVYRATLAILILIVITVVNRWKVIP